MERTVRNSTNSLSSGSANFDMENVEKLRDIFNDAIITTDANPLKKKIE